MRFFASLIMKFLYFYGLVSAKMPSYHGIFECTVPETAIAENTKKERIDKENTEV